MDIELNTNWDLDSRLTNYIISFIPFSERSALFHSCKILKQACFDDFWSSNISIDSYLNHIASLSYNLENSQVGIFKDIFKNGNVDEIKLVCRYGRFKFITDFLHLVPAKSFYEILRWSLTQMGINQPIFEQVATASCINGVEKMFDLLVSNSLYNSMWHMKLVAFGSRSTTKLASLLHLAAYINNVHIVRNILEQKTFTQEELSIALYEACVAGPENIEKVEEQFNWPVRNRKNVDAVAVAKLLISKGADVNSKKTDYPPLMSAFRKGDLKLIDYLIEMGADIHASSDDGQDDILSMSCFSFSTESVEKALQLGFSNKLNGVEYLANFLIEYEFFNENAEAKKDIVKICDVLIKAGARVNGNDKETIKLLILTCRYGMLEVIKLFASHGADYNHFFPNHYVAHNDLESDADDDEIYSTLSPIYAAIYSENIEIVKYLVKNLKVRFEKINETWPSPLIYAAQIVQSKEITKFLLDAGASASQEYIEMIKSSEDDEYSSSN